MLNKKTLYHLLASVIVILLSVLGACGQTPEKPASSPLDTIRQDRTEIPDSSGNTIQIIKTEAQKEIGVQKFDSLPKGKIRLKPSDYGNYIFIFADKDGKPVKEIADSELPANSRFKNLDFPRLYEANGEPIGGGIILYDLNGLRFEARKKVLQNAGVTAVPDSVVRRATNIIHYGNRVKFREADNFIIVTATSTFFDEAPKDQIYTCWHQTHISVFDSNGDVFKQLVVNHSVNEVLISDDGRFLFIMYDKYCRYGNNVNDIPSELVDLQTYKIDTINLQLISNGGYVPIDLGYAESYFQLFLSAGPNMIHVLINPSERKIYMKSYNEERFVGAYRPFKSMHLLDGQKIRIADYKMNAY